MGREGRGVGSEVGRAEWEEGRGIKDEEGWEGEEGRGLSEARGPQWEEEMDGERREGQGWREGGEEREERGIR